MGLFNSGWYYYTLKNGWQMHYSSKGIFKCPKAGESYSESQHSLLHTGQNTIEYGNTESTKLPNGDVKEVSTRTIRKVLKGRQYKCKCGAEMKFLGYPVYLKKILKEGRVIGGMFRMGGEDKRKPTRYFITTTAQQKYIRKMLATK